MSKEMYKQIEKYKDEMNRIKKEGSPISQELKDVRQQLQDVVHEIMTAKDGRSFVEKLNDKTSPLGLKRVELREKESELCDKRKIFDERIEECTKLIKQIEKQIQNERTQKEVEKYQSNLEDAGVDEAEYRRQRILKDYGTTDRPQLAGYIFPNGEMIDMSDGMMRGEDHRMVRQYFSPDSKEYANQETAMYSFIGEGNIRWMPEGPGLTINENCPITREQKYTLYDIVDYVKNTAFINGSAFHVDIVNDDMQVVKSLSYEDGHLNASKIYNDVNRTLGIRERNQSQEYER